MEIAVTEIMTGLGWAIVHSIWQGALAAIFVFTFRSLTHERQANLRCGAELFALMACLTAFIATFWINFAGAPPSILAGSSIIDAGGTTANSGILDTGAVTMPVTGFDMAALANYAPWLGILWSIGIAFMAARYGTALIMTQRLRRQGISPVPDQWKRRFATLLLNSDILRRVDFHISSKVTGPITLGFFRPVVLVPASFFAGLPADQIEAILLHEIAHIRRHDYLINLWQTAVKVIFFYHPAIHYICRHIDDDREQACDDFAVRQTKDPKSLVKGLAAIRLSLAPQNFALAAADHRKPLLRRLTRLMAPEKTRRRPEHVVTSLAALLLTASAYTVLSSNMASAHPADEAELASDLHVSPDLKNYRFATTPFKGRNITYKQTTKGERWININDGWHNIDANPQVLAEVPERPVPPVMPNPDNFRSYVKFEKSARQYRVNLDYYIASLENLPGDVDVSRELSKAYAQRRRTSQPGPDFDLDYLKPVRAELPITIAEISPSPQPAPAPAPLPKLAGAPKPGVHIHGEHIDDLEWSDELENKIENLAEEFENAMEDIEDDFEETLDRFEDSAERYGENPKAHESDYANAKTELAEAINAANNKRDRLTKNFDKDLGELMKGVNPQNREVMREAELALRSAERDARLAQREAQREMKQAAKEAALARREAERAHAQSQKDRKRHHDHVTSQFDTNEYKSALMNQLKKHGLIDNDAQSAKVEFAGNLTIVNGQIVPDNIEGEYCDLNRKYGLKKSKQTTISITPENMSIITTGSWN